MDTRREAREHEVLAMIQEMNRCWTETWDEQAFGKFIHPDAVAIAPLTPGRLEGRDAYIAGWRAFVKGATIHAWEETGHRIRFFCRDTCAVVTYFFVIRFDMGGQDVTMKGRDMFTLVRQGGRWLVAADQFSPEPAEG
ncbi:nuclear transport factor 2 family protein [Methanoregula sp.]|uniref:YybH family protein n=1 Tax=Methanoregula sp. TaxID=2052170 RepID=UPI002CFE6C70|nr:nuclear transport factor 2 family protein [Methanoregula sp.]HVP96307.1 nuclear transport factor 2 family protein [Methanoregula sp.]